MIFILVVVVIFSGPPKAWTVFPDTEALIYQQVGSATVTTRSDLDERCTDTALLSAIAEALFTSTALIALLGVLVRRSLTCVLKIRGQ